MFQNFEERNLGSETQKRVARLRSELSKLGLDAFLVPRGDQHRGEYVAAASERLAWLTGFTGSAGFSIIAQKSAVLFVDGRYTVQAKAQVPAGIFEVVQIPGATAEDWLIDKLAKGTATVGYDPWLHSAGEIERLTDKLKPRDIKLKPVAANPIDRIWGNVRPPPPLGPIVVQPLSRAGRSAEEKIAELRSSLAEADQAATVLTAPDSICWLLNIRGSDVLHNPVVLSFAIVQARGKVELFTETDKLNEAAKAHLSPFACVLPPSEFSDRLEALVAKGNKVRIDKDTCPVCIMRRLGGPKQISYGPDLCVLPKAVKNKVEIRGARAAHKRDAVAVCRFLAWLEQRAPAGQVDEILAAKQLETFRRDTGKLREISFDTISGSGPNGAIVHYRVTEASNRKLGKGELYLVDSGAQYADGTTDITRTIAIGRPSDEMRDRFTRVLKGHIAIACAAVPEGTRGVDLDPFARRALWDDGLDFDHGTGHGVGSYLSVHEGPQSISRRGMVALQPGMIISNEPGYYKEGSYGIRIENLILVEQAKRVGTGDRHMLTFETLTLAPIDRRLIKPSLLTPRERTWIDNYHGRVQASVAPDLEKSDRAWLVAACAPI
ncbi:MAG: aminopeptidase P family protein [Hyphomicrobiaceae bacterium]